MLHRTASFRAVGESFFLLCFIKYYDLLLFTIIKFDNIWSSSFYLMSILQWNFNTHYFLILNIRFIGRKHTSYLLVLLVMGHCKILRIYCQKSNITPYTEEIRMWLTVNWIWAFLKWIFNCRHSSWKSIKKLNVNNSICDWVIHTVGYNFIKTSFLHLKPASSS